MKIVFLMKQRPDYVQRMPTGVDWFQANSDEQGRYSADTLARLSDADAMIVAHEQVTKEVLAAMPRLKIIQRAGVGYDNVDLAAATQRNIPVCNLADVNKHAVAEHGMALMLSLARRMVDNHNLTQKGDWAAARALLDDTTELQGKRLGVLGFGKSGYELARRGHAFGMEIFYHNRSPVQEQLRASLDAQPLELDELCRISDFLSVIVSLNPSTVNLIDDRRIRLMQPTAYLIHLARGGIVNEHALADALNQGRLAGAGVDVFSQEPIGADNPLLTARNTVLTSHGAGTTKECTDREVAWALDNIQQYLEQGQTPKWIVNGVTP